MPGVLRFKSSEHPGQYICAKAGTAEPTSASASSQVFIFPVLTMPENPLDAAP